MSIRGLLYTLLGPKRRFKNIYVGENGSYQVISGRSIKESLIELVEAAKVNHQFVKIQINGVNFHIQGNSRPDLLYRDYFRALRGHIDNLVGPYPYLELTPAEIKRETQLDAQREQAMMDSLNQAIQLSQERTLQFEKKYLHLPQIELIDQQAWQADKDSCAGDDYSLAIVEFAERWARLMQSQISQGKTISEIAKQTENEADTEVITGHMYGQAVYLLSKHWIHGEALRTWHNIRVSPNSDGLLANLEGEVINPAVFRINTKHQDPS
jgi:hypothetical protein